MRWLAFLLILIALGCQTKSDSTRGGIPRDLCQYSKLLTITPVEDGYSIEIHNPEHPQESFRLYLKQTFHRIAALSSTHVGMITALGQERRLCAISDKRYLYAPKVKKLLAQGRVVDLQSEQQLSVKKLVGAQTQALIYSGFGSEKAQIKRLRSIGITCIPNFEWRETHPLARAEWLLLFGVLTGQLERAQALFKQVCANYKRIRQQPTLCNSNPNVMISGYIYGDQWVAPAGNSFEAKLYRDAEMSYYFGQKTGTGSCFSSIPSILTKSAAVVIWLNPGQSSRAALLANYPKYKYFPFFNKRIFCYTHNTNFYWECAAVRPDWVLSDLRNIRDHQTDSLYFYKELQP